MTLDLIRKFGPALSARLREGDPTFGRAYINLLVDKVELSSTAARISGARSALEHALVKDGHYAFGRIALFNRKWCQKRTVMFRQVVLPQPFAALIRRFDTVKNTVTRLGLALDEDVTH